LEIRFPLHPRPPVAKIRCIVSSPLVLGTDLTDPSVLARVWPIVANAEAIAVNQQWHGHPGRLVAQSPSFTAAILEQHDVGGIVAAGAIGWQVWAKPQADGAMAVFVLNAGGTPVAVEVPLASLGLSGECSVRDIWAQAAAGTARGTWSIHDLAPHDSRFVLLTPKTQRV